MLNERERPRNFVQNRNSNEYILRISELKSSTHFWGKNRLISTNWYRIVAFTIIALVISLSAWFIFMNLFKDQFLSSILTICFFISLSILIQPQIASRILKGLSDLDKATIEDVDLSRDMRLFFYRDVETGELYKDILYVERNGRLAAFGMYKIDTVPIAISGNFNKFIRAIYGQEEKIPIFWNYLQSPITEKDVMRLSNLSLGMREQLREMSGDLRNNYILNQEGVWEARIVFGTSASQRIGINATNTIQEIFELVTGNMKKLRAAFSVNFPHTKIVQLKGKDILSAIYAQITNGGHFRFF